jgi:signal transduction histidine kinase
MSSPVGKRKKESVAAKSLKTGTISFQAEGRLLQELGERLVASPEVALVELIKNAYDADSDSCTVHIDEKSHVMTVQDKGTGMSFDAFESRWMSIGTSNKAEQRLSTKYKRRLTGQKGIGRFAARFLGNHLTLDTIAYDETRQRKTRLLAEFPWAEIDKAEALGSTQIKYQLLEAGEDEQSGTLLTIRNVKTDGSFAKTSSFRTDVLKIVTPIQGLNRGRFDPKEEAKKAGNKGKKEEVEKDPGFKVSLPGDENRQTAKGVDLASTVLNHAWAKLEIDLNEETLRFNVQFSDGTAGDPFEIECSSSIANGLFADIRFFPRRSGIFRGTEVKGAQAWHWVRENAGVAIIDHGFRIKPYGFRDDDWLSLDLDTAHNERSWRSFIAEEHFPMTKAEKEDPAINPMLNLPNNLQLVGAVFVESQPASISKSEIDLTPSMDREGFLRNGAFRQVVMIVRAGIEYLAKEDKKRQLAAKEQRAREAAGKVRADFRQALAYIQNSPTLTAGDKARLIEEYSGFAKKIEEVEEYDREARRKLEVMSSLGVVAGFVTHEATRIVSSLNDAITELRALAKAHPKLRDPLSRLEGSYAVFKGHLEYTTMFVDGVNAEGISPFKAAPQVRRIKDKFGAFAKERGIDVTSQIAADVEVPAMPVAVYSGILLNLYTNALKAIVASHAQTEKPKIVFKSWNEPKKHIVEVIDNGVGIPPNMRKRVWDPLFTTTSRLNNPLGSGMGLGLSLVRQLVQTYKGRIEIVEPPAGFSTCFKVELPR